MTAAGIFGSASFGFQAQPFPCFITQSFSFFDLTSLTDVISQKSGIIHFPGLHPKAECGILTLSGKPDIPRYGRTMKRGVLMHIPIRILRPEAKLPTYGTEAAAGADLTAAVTEPLTILPGETVLIPHGISVAIPEGYAGFIYARSGLASKKGLAPANKVGVVDADYRGELMTPIHNHGREPVTIRTGDRIAQLVIAPVIRAEFDITDSLSETERGEGGFGSTGLN